MNLFSVIATAVAGWFLFGRTRLNFHRGNTPKNRLPFVLSAARHFILDFRRSMATMKHGLAACSAFIRSTKKRN